MLSIGNKKGKTKHKVKKLKINHGRECKIEILTTER